MRAARSGLYGRGGRFRKGDRMTRAQHNPLLHFLRKLAGGDAPLVPDADLLRRFARDADRSAFELLLWRHGPMVLRTCQAALQDAHDAEDAFQAAFLVLARKAGSIGRREALGAWLYRVAHRIAVKLHRQARRRAGPERQGLDLDALAVEAARPDAAAEGELRRLVHAEVERLPEKYRAPVVLCYLEGRTNEEAAAQLGWPRGTVSGRLARARDLLRRRLERCGLPVSAGAALTLLAGDAAAAVPPALVAPTVNAAVTAASGGPLTGLVSPQVLSLTEGAMTAMTAVKLKLVLGLLLGLTAAGAVAYPTANTGGGDGGNKEGAAAAPLMRVVRVPSPQDGILLAVGTEVKKGDAAAAAKGLLRVEVGKEVRLYRRLREGDRVERGQVLAQLDDRLARLEVAIKKARVSAAKVEYPAALAMAREAQARLDRLDQLKNQNRNLVSAEEYTAAVLTRDKHEQEKVSKGEQVKLSEIELKQAQILLEMYTIRSPVRGVLSRIHKYRGEAVRGLETVFEVQAPDRD
jgi:RNA polymerase sigma factor (sigma-70 family)